MIFRGISQSAIRELVAANRLFLDLLRRRPAGTEATTQFGMERRCMTLVQALDVDAVAQAANCPFALFGFGFQERVAWRRILDLRVGEPGISTWSTDESDLNQFVLMVLTAVRYLSAQEPRAAAMLYGVPPDLTRRLAAVDLALLPGLVPVTRSRLAIAPTASPAFWRDLVMASQDGDSGAADAVHALGLQLTMQRALGLLDCHVTGKGLIRSG